MKKISRLYQLGPCGLLRDEEFWKKKCQIKMFRLIRDFPNFVIYQPEEKSYEQVRDQSIQYQEWNDKIRITEKEVK